MPKLRCPCGFVHNLSPIPDAGWVTFQDTDYEQVVDAENRKVAIAGPHVPSDAHPRVAEWDEANGVIAEKMGRMYECPNCQRLMWEREGGTVYRVYRLEVERAD